MQHLQGKETGNYKFHNPTPRGDDLGVKNVKLMIFKKNLLLYSGAWLRQTKCKVLINKEVSIKIVNFMTPQAARGSCAGALQLSHIVKMHYFFKNSQAQITQTESMVHVMIIKEESTIIVNFVTLAAGTLIKLMCIFCQSKHQ